MDTNARHSSLPDSRSRFLLLLPGGELKYENSVWLTLEAMAYPYFAVLDRETNKRYLPPEGVAELLRDARGEAGLGWTRKAGVA